MSGHDDVEPLTQNSQLPFAAEPNPNRTVRFKFGLVRPLSKGLFSPQKRNQQESVESGFELLCFELGRES